LLPGRDDARRAGCRFARPANGARRRHVAVCVVHDDGGDAEHCRWAPLFGRADSVEGSLS